MRVLATSKGVVMKAAHAPETEPHRAASPVTVSLPCAVVRVAKVACRVSKGQRGEYLEILVQGELDAGEGDLAQDCGEVAPIKA